MLTITTHDGATYHAEACAQTNGWRGEAIEAAIRLDVPRRSIDARISAASVMALGLLILRAQRREATTRPDAPVEKPRSYAMQAYSNPSRETDPYSLPDIEIFNLTSEVETSGAAGGWFWWACSPGCIPDGPPTGPFATREEALADARSSWEY